MQEQFRQKITQKQYISFKSQYDQIKQKQQQTTCNKVEQLHSNSYCQIEQKLQSRQKKNSQRKYNTSLQNKQIKINFPQNVNDSHIKSRQLQNQCDANTKKSINDNKSKQIQNIIQMKFALPIVGLKNNAGLDKTNKKLYYCQSVYSSKVCNKNKSVYTKKNSFIINQFQGSPNTNKSQLKITSKNIKQQNINHQSKQLSEENKNDLQLKNFNKSFNKVKQGQKQYDVDSVIKLYKANNIKDIQRKLRSTMSKVYQTTKTTLNFKNQQKKLRTSHNWKTKNQLKVSKEFNPVFSVREYNRKCGYTQNTKIFIFNSQDHYIKQILLSWGWVQNPVILSPFYNLKWTYSPIVNDFKRDIIEEKEDSTNKFTSIFYNHFQNTHQITSKSYLSTNLKQSQSLIGSISSFIPKSYDFRNLSECEQFLEQFKKTLMTAILQNYYNYFKKNRKQFVQQLQIYYRFKYQKLIKAKQPLKNYYKKSTLLFHKKTFKAIELQNIRFKDNNFLIHANLTLICFRYWRKNRKNSQNIHKLGHQASYNSFIDFNQNQFNNNWEIIKQMYRLQAWFQPNDINKYFSKEYYQTPSDIAIQQIVKQYTYLLIDDLLCNHQTTNLSIYQRKQIVSSYGSNNIWIVKPSQNARGAGIRLLDSETQIIQQFKGIKSRIVQKYIQRPLLLKSRKYPNLNNRKFDIRQWVLLKSIDPLEIYMFSHCYLRFCCQQYSLDPNYLQHLQKHLTNYSMNKQKYKQSNQIASSILNSEQIADILQQQYGICWQTVIKPQIKDIVFKSIKACQQNLYDEHSIEGYSELKCFEMFGYDILIDENFKCWLLQVNLSPACQQRTVWLKRMLRQMGEGLLKIVLPSQFLPDEDIPVQQQVDDNIIGNYKWELITIQQYHFSRQYHTDKILQIKGQAISPSNKVKKIDFEIKNKSAILIQRKFREYYLTIKQKENQQAISSKIIKLYFKTKLQKIQYQQKVKKYYQQSIKFYMKSSLLIITSQLKLKQNKSIQVIERYLQGIFTYKKYIQKKKTSFLDSISTYYLSHQFVTFAQYIKISHQNLNIIKYYCKKKIFAKSVQCKAINTYLQSIIIFKEYQNTIKQKYFSSIKFQKINQYLKGFCQQKKLKQNMKTKNTSTIINYLKGKIQIINLFQKKVIELASILGRIVRVSSRRVRGNALKIMLQIWTQQKFIKNTKCIEKYFKSYLNNQIYSKKMIKNLLRELEKIRT